LLPHWHLHLEHPASSVVVAIRVKKIVGFLVAAAVTLGLTSVGEEAAASAHQSDQRKREVTAQAGNLVMSGKKSSSHRSPKIQTQQGCSGGETLFKEAETEKQDWQHWMRWAKI
jgi:hypothetical protein